MHRDTADGTAMMKPAREWAAELAGDVPPPDICLEEGREGEPTLRVGKAYLHSRYKPREEARRLLDSADLNPARPVLVVGVGLGYHILELSARGFRVAAVEPERAIAALAVQGPLRDSEALLGLGEPDDARRLSPLPAIRARNPAGLRASTVRPPPTGICRSDGRSDFARCTAGPTAENRRRGADVRRLAAHCRLSGPRISKTGPSDPICRQQPGLEPL
ncbi:MAG: hypothetical protein ACOX5J_14465 [Candidatus Hydrogenedentales bacterium]